MQRPQTVSTRDGTVAGLKGRAFVADPLDPNATDGGSPSCFLGRDRDQSDLRHQLATDAAKNAENP
ncbi:hypothetical protein BURKHO8Y_10482 [Burkholderia sp. 8Y]|nr:hypothetical protein BURKHO8Y_10482 [Burkholderia sp. 8Y]